MGEVSEREERIISNTEIAQLFYNLADLLEKRGGENPFKIRAYRRAARAIETLSVGVGTLAREGRLREVPGIGEAIDKKIREYIATGRLGLLERLRQELGQDVSC